MRTKITAVDVHDVRFPTAAAGDGSDAMNRGDYSASYVELRTDAGPTGAGLTFTNGRGNEITCAAVRALDGQVVGRTIEEIFDEPVAFWRSLTADPQLRWIGPEKGVIHMATGAVVNAVWDLRAKRAVSTNILHLPARVVVTVADRLTPADDRKVLEELSGVSERRTLLRFLRLSPSRFHAWRGLQHACALDDQSSGPHTLPHRLTPPRSGRSRTG